MAFRKLNSRIYVKEYLGDNQAIFECKEGHTWKMKMISQPLRGIGEAGLKKMANWWSKQNGGCTGKCPRC